MTRRLTAKDIPELLQASLNALKAEQDRIDKLNVYPVPDGDTGTNMVLTMQSVYEEVSKVEKSTMGNLAQAITYGSLMGARGNSGVILSQIMRGVCEIVGSKDILTSATLTEALKRGAQIAYLAIRKPVEGTMLTVIRDIAAAAEKFKSERTEIETLVGAVLEEAEKSVERTPELLSVLKEAGVVDAGGYGLKVMIKGILAALKGEEIEALPAEVSSLSAEEEVSLKYTYCTEFLLKSDGTSISVLEKKLDSLGDSVMVVGTENLSRLHVHTNSPGKVLELATGLGSISQIQINNMVEQAEERKKALAKSKPKQTGKVAVLAVANGKGIKEILLSLGVAKVIEGGQSMNPSAAELSKAVEEVSSREVIILPNNKNIILAAEQVGKLTRKKVAVVPTVSIPQAFSVMLEFNPELSLSKNIKAMKEALIRVKTGQVTLSTRDSKYEGGEIKKDDFIGLYDHKIKTSGKSLVEVASGLIDKMVGEEDEVLTVLAGCDVSKGETDKLLEVIEKKYPELEVELHNGGQPVYHLIIGLE